MIGFVIVLGVAIDLQEPPDGPYVEESLHPFGFEQLGAAVDPDVIPAIRSSITSAPSNPSRAIKWRLRPKTRLAGQGYSPQVISPFLNPRKLSSRKASCHRRRDQ